MIPILYLDIDGTVRYGKSELGYFAKDVTDIHVFPKAVERMREWKSNGGRIVGVSNQGGLAFGFLTVEKVNSMMMETQRQADNLFDMIVWCPHHPAAPNDKAVRCWCRKPFPGLVISAAYRLGLQHSEEYDLDASLMVGDRYEDYGCARNANLNFLWAQIWRGEED